MRIDRSARAGAAGALALARVLDTLLFDVTPTDPATFITAIAALGTAALAAAAVPAWRAARVDPMVTLPASQPFARRSGELRLGGALRARQSRSEQTVHDVCLDEAAWRRSRTQIPASFSTNTFTAGYDACGGWPAAH